MKKEDLKIGIKIIYAKGESGNKPDKFPETVLGIGTKSFLTKWTSDTDAKTVYEERRDFDELPKFALYEEPQTIWVNRSTKTKRIASVTWDSLEEAKGSLLSSEWVPVKFQELRDPNHE